MKDFTIEEYKQSFLNEDRLATCYAKKWFKMFVPKSYGGLQLSMENACRELIQISTLQGGLGWTVNLGAGANWFAGFFEDEIAKKLFTNEKVVIAGSGFANGSWHNTDCGFSISGQWSKCTGANHATLFSLIAKNENKGDKVFVVPSHLVQLSEEKWPIMGMRNSSSYGIVLEDVSTPFGYDFEINKIKNHEDYGVFHIPFQYFARLCMSASYLGTVRCLINICQTELAKPQVISIINGDLLSRIEKAEQLLFEYARKVEKLSKENIKSELDDLKINSILSQNNLAIFDGVQQLFLAGGLPFIEEDKLVHWAYRDVLTAVQHHMVKS